MDNLEDFSFLDDYLDGDDYLDVDPDSPSYRIILDSLINCDDTSPPETGLNSAPTIVSSSSPTASTSLCHTGVQTVDSHLDFSQHLSNLVNAACSTLFSEVREHFIAGFPTPTPGVNAMSTGVLPGTIVSDNNSKPGPSNTKRLTFAQLKFLRTKFDINSSPTPDVINQYSDVLGVPSARVRRWFRNHRFYLKKKISLDPAN